MNEIERIVDQVRKSFEGGAWHGPSVSEVLSGVTADLAHRRGVPGGHSIAALAMHLLVTEEIMLGRISGTVGAVEDSQYWRTLADETEATWQSALEQLRDRHNALVPAIARFDPERLDQPLFEGGSPAFNNFLGHAQHNTYHAGQIALLKRLAAPR